jgi:hypothetical protein
MSWREVFRSRVEGMDSRLRGNDGGGGNDWERMRMRVSARQGAPWGGHYKGSGEIHHGDTEGEEAGRDERIRRGRKNIQKGSHGW